MKQLIISLIAGLLTNIVLATATDHLFHTTDIYPSYGLPMFNTGLVLLAFTYRALFIILSAYLTAFLAQNQAKKAIWILGFIGSSLWLMGAIMMWHYTPVWYNLGGIVLGVPLTLLGGKLYAHRTKPTNSVQVPVLKNTPL